MSTASLTGTRTATSTMTVARVRKVMTEVQADFYNIALAELWPLASATRMAEDLTYLLGKEVVKSFQLQFNCPGHPQRALEYVVDAYGALQTADKAGGIDYLSLPHGTRARLFVDINFQSAQIQSAQAYLVQQGWQFDGAPVTGGGQRDRVYSNEGYGMTRTKIGGW